MDSHMRPCTKTELCICFHATRDTAPSHIPKASIATAIGIFAISSFNSSSTATIETRVHPAFHDRTTSRSCCASPGCSTSDGMAPTQTTHQVKPSAHQQQQQPQQVLRVQLQADHTSRACSVIKASDLPSDQQQTIPAPSQGSRHGRLLQLMQQQANRALSPSTGAIPHISHPPQQTT